MGLRSFRKKRRPGNSKPTPAEERRIQLAKEGPCTACLVRFQKRNCSLIVVGCEYNHVKSGNIRISHRHGYGLCQWHHKGYPIGEMDDRMTAAIYGPSLIGNQGGGKPFHEAYGSDAELIAICDDLVGWVDTDSQDE